MNKKVIKKNKITIVLAHPADPFYPIQGGAIRNTLELLEYLLKQDIPVTFVGANFDVPKKKKKLKKLKNLNFYAINGYASACSWQVYLSGLFLKGPFISIPKKAIIHTYRLDYMIPFIFYYPKNPKVVTLDKQTTIFQLKHPMLYRLLKPLIIKAMIFFFKKVDLVITDKTSLNFYMTFYPEIKEKAIVMPQSLVNLSKFKPVSRLVARKHYGFQMNEKILIYVGRLEKEKNIEFLIRVIKQLKEVYPTVKLLLIGRGQKNYVASLKEFSRSLGVQKNIIFLGERSHSEIPLLLSCADVFVLSSFTEGSPTVIKESLACGVPVVSTNVGDVKELIKNKYLGVVVSSYRIDTFVDGILYAFSLDRKKVITEGRRVLTELGLDSLSVGEKILKVYFLLSKSS